MFVQNIMIYSKLGSVFIRDKAVGRGKYKQR